MRAPLTKAIPHRSAVRELIGGEDTDVFNPIEHSHHLSPISQNSWRDHCCRSEKVARAMSGSKASDLQVQTLIAFLLLWIKSPVTVSRVETSSVNSNLNVRTTISVSDEGLA